MREKLSGKQEVFKTKAAEGLKRAASFQLVSWLSWKIIIMVVSS